jgi:hypothetical protein
MHWIQAFDEGQRFSKARYITNYMKQGPSWETNMFQATQETPRILLNQKVHYRVHNSLSTSDIHTWNNLLFEWPRRRTKRWSLQNWRSP